MTIDTPHVSRRGILRVNPEQLARWPRDYLAWGQDTWKDGQIGLRWVRNNPVAWHPRCRSHGYWNTPRHRGELDIRTGSGRHAHASTVLRIRGTSAKSRLPRPRYRLRVYSSASRSVCGCRPTKRFEPASDPSSGRHR